MSQLSVRLLNGSAFQPGEAIQGQVSWSLERSPDWVKVRLFWFTEGKGDRDVGIADDVSFDHPPAQYDSEFHFTAPAEPWSYDGTLLSIQWAIEVVCKGEKDIERTLLVIAPNRTAVTPPRS